MGVHLSSSDRERVVPALSPSTGCGFDAGNAYQHIADLCYPRRVGTPHERRAARYIRDKLSDLGLRVARDPFFVSPGSMELGSRVVFGSAAVLALVGGIVGEQLPLISAVCWIVAAYLVNRPFRLAGCLGTLCRRKVVCENIIATSPRSADNAPARLIFMAHYDTKSQFLPTGIRVGLVSTVTFVCGLLAFLGLAATVGWPRGLDLVGPIGLSVLAAVLSAGLVANCAGNRSPGALDNGSGLGTLLELARTWTPQPEAPAEVYWVATGSEEVGLNGARHFLQKYEHWWSDKPTLLINLESVGAGHRIYLAGERQSLRLAREVADDLDLPYAQLHVLGAGMDHQPFAARNLACVSILGDVVRHSFYMHSARDNMNLIDHAALERAARLAAHIAWSWADIQQLTPKPPVSSPDVCLSEDASVPS